MFKSFRLCRLFGLDINVDLTLMLLILLVSYNFGSYLTLIFTSTSSLEIGVCAIESNYESIERQLIVALKPVLNLKGWDNPYRKDIKALRKVCAEEARQNRPADR